MKSIRKAVFPVGGMGTRFLPATKAIPKEMLPVVDKPLIQYAVEEARAAGIEEFIFVTGRGKAAIEDHFDQSYELQSLLTAHRRDAELKILGEAVLPPGAVSYTRQQEPKGLGHAVLCAQHLVGDEPFAVLLPDELLLSATPCLREVVDLYQAEGGCALALADIPPDQADRYGIVSVAEDRGRTVIIDGMVEKPKPEEAPSSLAIIGRYVLQPEVFDLLRSQPAGVGGELQLTDSVASLVGTMPFHGIRYAGRRFDCGSKAGFLKANVAYALERDDLRDELSSFLKQLSAE